VANTQAYYDTATITAVKSLIVQAAEEEEKSFGKVCQGWRLKDGLPGPNVI
jgi:hypothetical protein